LEAKVPSISLEYYKYQFRHPSLKILWMMLISYFNIKKLRLVVMIYDISESKIAPMLVTGSYVGWLMMIISKYLQAGRLKQIRMYPYLTNEEGLAAVYQYAEFYNEPITNETAVQINELCLSDPFFISCVIQSEYDDKELMTSEGVINTVHYEISDRNSEMSKTWNEYLQLTLQRVNDRNAKNILLFLSEHADRDWMPSELKKELSLDLEINQIQKKLEILSEASVKRFSPNC
jgi:hypothetical protein